MQPPYPGCPPYPGSSNQHGEVEKIADLEVTHWFVEAVRSRYHFVTAGDPNSPINPPNIASSGSSPAFTV